SRAEAVGCMSFQVEGSDDAVSIFRSSLAHLKRSLRLKEDRNDQRWRVARPIRSSSSFSMKHAVVTDGFGFHVVVAAGTHYSGRTDRERADRIPASSAIRRESADGRLGSRHHGE